MRTANAVADPLPSPTSLSFATVGRSIPKSLTPLSNLLDREVRPPSFVVAPFLPRGELTEIVGAHGSFKSTLALDACLSVATGRAWGSYAVEKGRAAFITLEDSSFTLQRRVMAWLDGVASADGIEASRVERAQAERDARANFAFVGREDAQGIVLTATDGNGFTRARTDVADQFAALVDGCSLVVLETVSRIHDGQEDNASFRALVESLERIVVQVSDAALVIVRHVSKNAVAKLKSGDFDAYVGRGGAALSDAVRSCLVVVRANGAVPSVTVHAVKTTHAQEGATMSWRPIFVPARGAVRMEPITEASLALADAQQLRAFIAANGGSIVKSDFKKGEIPCGLTRPRAEAAIDALVGAGRLIPQPGRGGGKRYYSPSHPDLNALIVDAALNPRKRPRSA
jgi:hypothetical protein